MHLLHILKEMKIGINIFLLTLNYNHLLDKKYNKLVVLF